MTSIRVDIVSDVVCPWCIVGLKQLESAAQKTGHTLDVYWHPFELNPKMPETGQDLQEHMNGKYGTTVEQSNEARERLTTVGDELGFAFKFNEKSRMVNTFKAHQLLHWATEQSTEQGHTLKLALFSAYFTQQLDVSDTQVLLEVVSTAGLDATEAKRILDEAVFDADVRSEQQLWISRGVSGVPAMVFGEKYLATGAQGDENYSQILNTVAEEMATDSAS